MCSKMGSIRRAGLILGLIFLIMGLNPNDKQSSLAAQTKGSGDTPQKSWKPAGPMTMLLGTGAGTAYDFLARQMAVVLPDYLGKPVTVDIQPGGGGSIALDILARAKPDGQTFCLYGVGTQITLMFEKRYKWDVKDLSLILAIETPPYAVVASAKHTNYKSYGDLKKAKEPIRIATAGPNFAVVPLIMQLEKDGIKYRAARLKGAAEANLAVIAGDADITISASSSVILDPIRAGDMRPLWIFDDKRYKDLPDVPTHIEAGMPPEWAAYHLVRLIAVRSAVPVDIQNALTVALIKGLQDKRTVEWSKKAEIPVDTLERKEVEERIRIVQEGFRNNLQIAKRYFF